MICQKYEKKLNNEEVDLWARVCAEERQIMHQQPLK